MRLRAGNKPQLIKSPILAMNTEDCYKAIL